MGGCRNFINRRFSERVDIAGSLDSLISCTNQSTRMISSLPHVINFHIIILHGFLHFSNIVVSVQLCVRTL